MRVLQRDPFARANLERESHPGQGRSCTWCGQSRRTLYSYAWQSDTFHPLDHLERAPAKLFCSVGCWRAYNG